MKDFLPKLTCDAPVMERKIKKEKEKERLISVTSLLCLKDNLAYLQQQTWLVRL